VAIEDVPGVLPRPGRAAAHRTHYVRGKDRRRGLAVGDSGQNPRGERKPPAREEDPVTLRTYAQPWLADRPLKPRTREHYQSLLDRPILPILGDKPIAAITPVMVRTWHADLGGKVPTLRAHAYALLRSILTSALEDGLIPSNPCHIRGAGVSKRVHKIRPLTMTELDVLVEHMPPKHKAMVLLTAWCGAPFR
jgi:integrase